LVRKMSSTTKSVLLAQLRPASNILHRTGDPPVVIRALVRSSSSLVQHQEVCHTICTVMPLD
jgi:hypothetical protein